MTEEKEKVNRPLDTMDEVAYHELEHHYREAKRTIENYKKRCQQAQLELSLIKAVGQNSPEMKEAIAQIKELEIGLANALEINKSHQKLNGKLQERLTEVEGDNKKLADQIEHRINQLRKSGM
jgi:predicted  nucleic acid-binding Zn-ribbon protein